MLEECALTGEILECNAERRSRSEASHVLQRIRRASVLEEVIRGVQAARSVTDSALAPGVVHIVSNS